MEQREHCQPTGLVKEPLPDFCDWVHCTRKPGALRLLASPSVVWTQEKPSHGILLGRLSACVLPAYARVLCSASPQLQKVRFVRACETSVAATLLPAEFTLQPWEGGCCTALSCAAAAAAAALSSCRAPVEANALPLSRRVEETTMAGCSGAGKYRVHR